MKSVTINFEKSDKKPTKAQDGAKFLLCWAGWQYSVMTWSHEYQDFYQDGDYIKDWSNPFVWAELPKTI